MVQNEPSLPLVDIEGALKYWENYQELTKKLLDESDYQKIGDKSFKKKSAWRKYATFMNITTTTVNETLTHDEQGRIVTAKYEVKATAPNGRSETGIGLCSIWDKAHEHNKQFGQRTCKGPCDGRKHFDKPEHDIPSTAHTRAKNRAISDLIGAGEVSAEEIDFTNTKSKKSKPDLKNIPSPESEASLVNDIVNNEVVKKDEKPPAPPEKTPKSVDKSTVQDAEITEKKGSKPGGKDAITEDMSKDTSVDKPLYIHCMGINTEFDQICESTTNKEALTDKKLKELSKKLKDSGSMTTEEHSNIMEQIKVWG